MLSDSVTPARTLRPVPQLDYYDKRTVALARNITALDAWNIMTGVQHPVPRLAFKIRDAISSRFGVKRIGGFSGIKRESVKAGERLDFFLVEHSAPDMLVLTERDRHLDVMICISIADGALDLTSSVVTHNAFGRLYMLPVGPAHKIIVNSNLRRLKHVLEQRARSAQ